MKILRFLRLDPKTLISGLLVVFAFPPWNFSALIWISLVPWFWTLDESKSMRHSIWQGYWLGAIMTIGGFHWVAGSIHAFGEIPWVFSYLLLLLFTLICQPQFWLFVPFYYYFKNRFPAIEPWKKTLLISLAYTAIDSALPKLFVDTLGNSLSLFQNIRQIAELSGSSTLTFLILFENLALSFWLRRKWQKKAVLQNQWFIQGIALALILIVWIFGWIRRDQINSYYEKGENIRFSLIQANIGNFEKVVSESGFVTGGNRIVQKFFKLSRKALNANPKPDFIVWPETAYPSAFRVPRTNYELARDQKIEDFVQTRKVPLFFGGYDYQGFQDFNSFHFLLPKEQLPNHSQPENHLETYHKYLLLPFAEYIPGSQYFDWINKAFPQVANFGIGPGPVIHTFQTKKGTTINIAPQICYEVLKDWFVLEQARKGAQVLLNITNDSWFGDTTEPYQHLALATLRTIENRIPLIRSTNTGISALVDPTGEVVGRTAIREEAVLHADTKIVKTPPWTLYRQFGNWLGWLSALIVTGFLGVSLIRQRR